MNRNRRRQQWEISLNQYQCQTSPHNFLCFAVQFSTSCYYIKFSNLLQSGPGSSVGIVTGYGLDGPGIESQLGARFSTPIQTGPGAHPASCTMGTGSFPGVNSSQGVTLTPHPLLVPLWAVRPVQNLSASTRVHFTLLFFTLLQMRLFFYNLIYWHQVVLIKFVCNSLSLKFQ